MRFKQYLTKEIKESTIDEESMVDSDFLQSVNDALVEGLENTFFSPENGIQMIRRVLAEYNLEMPVLYGADPEGEETAVEIQPELFLYLIYGIDENGKYEFYAELTDDEGLDDLLSDEDEDIE